MTHLPVARQTAQVFLLSLLVVLVSRLPFMPDHLFSFDSVNFALALEEFDPNRNQPQPPGYPFFIAEARIFYSLLGEPEQTFAFVKILISGLAVGLLYLLGARLFSPIIGLTGAALLLVNPTFWHSGLASAIRPHLALISILFAYCCWRAVEEDHRFLLAGSALLGLSAGFRVELPVILFPLWIWTVWQIADWRIAFRALGLVLGGVAVWLATILLATSTPADSYSNLARYLFSQTSQSSPLTGADLVAWRRMLGRNIVWYGAGVICWIWAAPFGWKVLSQSSRGMHRFGLLAVWFVPAFLFNAVFHGAAPGHILAGVAPLCILGAVSLCAAEAAVRRRWHPLWPQGAILAGAVLICNLIFFAEHLPARIALSETTSRWRSITDPIRYGLYETSYRHVRWTDQMSDEAFRQIRDLKEGTDKPVVVVWSRDAEPVWRKVAYYFPDLPIYALEEKGDPAVPATRATLWKGSSVLAEYEEGGQVPVPIPIPPNARIIWLLHGSAGARLRRAVSLEPAPPVYYTDLPTDIGPFDWRSFRFVSRGQAHVHTAERPVSN